MKIITIEEHFESEVITNEINKVTGNLVSGQVSPEMFQYMQKELPSAAEMQDTEKRLAFMDQHGIDIQVLSYGNNSPQNLDPKISVALCKRANDELAKVIQQNPTRFAGFAVLPVGSPEDAAIELKRAVEELGFKGALVKGQFENKYFDNRFYYPIFEMAEKLDVPISFHPSFTPETITEQYFASDAWSDVVTGVFSSAGFGWHMDVGIQVVRMILSGIFDKLPNLKIITGHLGEMVPMFLNRMDNTLGHWTTLERKISDYYRTNVYVTPSGLLYQNEWKFLLNELDENHLIYALDYPFVKPENARTFLDTLDLTDEVKAKIAHENAEKLLHL
ncbi:amidohydrolase [Listeria monocytogenes]|uniref:Amidohydrolase n=1 Tax=Listeria monocytogenes TaxID=1639 RepID=A0A823DDQ1_LISMN|nr:amidohydrolase [Listeria monocytogenes]EAD1011661.1 amidohydrolase [Listeria monocytogenes]EAD1183829.1 amidohydrolase [Listeria monocytogenes]EAD1566530.1 amidohydrolase [Listeria monocytogenes]EAF8899822.1 amidohydrolase [Listeria monocytogenes]